MDKELIRISTFEGTDNDYEYWQTKTPEERVHALEHIRQQYIIGKYGTMPKLERVFTIVKRKER